VQNKDVPVQITISRQKPGEAQSFETYRVPSIRGMSVLEALEYVRRNHDLSLAFPYSCRHGKSCRTCLAEINGEVNYLCSTPLKDKMVIKPPPNRQVIRDLLTVA
jgi:succinate dehydrogenase/fumarate reductase-like Fe-S protein